MRFVISESAKSLIGGVSAVLKLNWVVSSEERSHSRLVHGLHACQEVANKATTREGRLIWGEMSYERHSSCCKIVLLFS